MNTPVSFEIAKLLKEKGFNEECYSYYVPEVHQKVCYQEYGGEKFDMNKVHTAFGKECFSAPTIAEVVMWLYEKHGIWITVTSISQESWQCHMTKKGDSLGKCYLEDFYNPTEAYEAAITYVLTKLI